MAPWLEEIHAVSGTWYAAIDFTFDFDCVLFYPHQKYDENRFIFSFILIVIILQFTMHFHNFVPGLR